MKRVLLILAPLILGFALFLGALEYFQPEIETFLTKEIRALSNRFTQVEITAEHVHFNFFPPAVSVENIQIAAKNPEVFGFDQLGIDSLEASLDFLQLLVGRIGISTLTLNNPEINLNLDTFLKESPNPKKQLNLNPLFEQLKILPIHRISIVDLSAQISSKKLKLDISLGESNALLINTGDSIILETELDAENVSYENLKDSAHLRMGAVLRRNEIEIPQFHLSTLSAEFITTGRFTHIEEPLENLMAQLNFNVSTDLSLLGAKLKNEFKIPDMSGKVVLKTELSLENNSIKTGNFEIHSEQLKVTQFQIGKVEFLGHWKDDKLSSELFQITNEAALVDFPGLEINWAWRDSKPSLSLKTKLKSEMLDLNQLLQNLGVGNLPVELIVDGELQCGGPIFPDPSVTCQGGIHSDMLEVRTGSDDVIVQLGEALVNGTVNIDKERVQYQANLKIGDSEGKSDGHISFADGFDISYDSPEVDFKNLDNLANLRLEGKAKLSGRTTGDSHQAVFYIDADAKDIWFENFYLGNPRLTARYKSGTLHFEKISSNINSSRIRADVEVNLNKNTIAITGESLDFEVVDGLAAFQRKVTLPIEATGSGDIHVKAWGPLDFAHLSYDFSATLQKGVLAGENYDSISTKIKSREGEVKLEQFHLQKGQGQILGQGVAHPNGTAELSLETLGMLIEESDNVARLSQNISGQWSSKLKFTGRILSPEIQLASDIKNLVVEDQELPSSQAQMTFNSHGVSGKADLFEGRLVSNFKLPFSDQDPFSFEASSRNWNFTTIFTLIGGAQILSDYQSSLTGDVHLQAEKGGFFAASGEGTIIRAELHRKNLRLINPGPMELKMEKGQLTLSNFRVSDENSYLEVSSNKSTKNSLNLKAKANLQLHIMQIFFPFLDELSGTANVQTSISGRFDKPEILGTGSLDNGFIKLKAFPHAFEKVTARAQFSQTKVIVSDVKGALAGGSFSGEGNLSIVALQNLPMVFKSHFDNVTVNVPENIRSSGSGDIVISGSWFPFTLSGNYHVNNGLVTKEFTDGNIGQNTKQSSYLPKMLLQSAFDPLTLNLQVILENPLPVKNSLMDGSVNGSIYLKGSPSSPNISGKIGIEHGAKISFRDKSFDVASGVVNFNDPKEINPEFFITAQAHVLDYDVNLTLQGNAKNPVVRLDSLPPLPYQDIVSLLALGITSGNLDDNGATQRRDSNALATQAMAAGINEISKNAQRAWDVNVQVTSQYDDTKNMSIQKYTISRKITDNVVLYGTQNTGDLESQYVQLKYKLNSNLSLSTSYENVEAAQSGTSTQAEPTGKILGIDLEFKQEFK